jgi:uncharacterized protein YdhG (YjbR/CyaY superfamily)
MATKNEAVDTYIAAYPPKTQKLLKQMRAVIRKTVPDAEEVISYSMPAYKYHGMLAWFAAHTNHIGLYPRAQGIENFKKELSSYKSAKGSVQFPLDKKLPVELIAKIVSFVANANELKAQAKKKPLKPAKKTTRRS